MSGDIPVITDYPFRDQQKCRFASLSDTYGYHALMIRMTDNTEILYQRSWQKDMEQSGHMGHLVILYQSGDDLEDRSLADAFLQFEFFREWCLTKAMTSFNWGN